MREQQQTLDQAFGTAVLAAAQRAPFGCVLVVFCGVVSLLLGLLTAYHVYLTSTNQTTNENVRTPAADRSPTIPKLAPAQARAPAPAGARVSAPAPARNRGPSLGRAPERGDPSPLPSPSVRPGPHQVRGVWEDTRNPYDRGIRRNWVEICCGRFGSLPPEKSPALATGSDEEAMLPSQPADHGRAGLGGAVEASRLEQGRGAAHGRAMDKGLAAAHDGQEMLPMGAPQPLPVADEGRAALPGGGGGGEASEGEVEGEE